ncbi:hypothetical protein Leryth_026013 [Lithospermum erythrorhizon]|nr:hypothetical protein Leryth_026013 [Lithospermum erythrorhizon]
MEGCARPSPSKVVVARSCTIFEHRSSEAVIIHLIRTEDESWALGPTIKFMNNLFADGRWPSTSVLLHSSAAFLGAQRVKEFACPFRASIKEKNLIFDLEGATLDEKPLQKLAYAT